MITPTVTGQYTQQGHRTKVLKNSLCYCTEI